MDVDWIRLFGELFGGDIEVFRGKPEMSVIAGLGACDGFVAEEVGNVGNYVNLWVSRFEPVIWCYGPNIVLTEPDSLEQLRILVRHILFDVQKTKHE